ncbi:MAG: class I SAM-dependent methyltransferase [Methanobacteriota archaeon]
MKEIVDIESKIWSILNRSESFYAHHFIKNLNRRSYIKRYIKVKRLDWDLTIKDCGRIILDDGCGNMIDAIYLGLHGFKVVAMDSSTTLIKAGLQLVNEEGLSDIIYPVVGDATQLPFKTEAFDTVVSYSCIDHVKGRTKQRLWIKEMSRATVKGGKIVLTTTNTLNPLIALLARTITILVEGYYETSLTPMFVKKELRKNNIRLIEFKSNTFFYPGYLGFTKLGYVLDWLLSYLEHIPQLKYFGGRMGFKGIKE